MGMFEHLKQSSLFVISPLHVFRILQVSLRVLALAITKTKTKLKFLKRFYLKLKKHFVFSFYFNDIKLIKGGIIKF